MKLLIIVVQNEFKTYRYSLKIKKKKNNSLRVNTYSVNHNTLLNNSYLTKTKMNLYKWFPHYL